MTAVNPKNLKIEMVHDIVCSWCPIGYSNIKAAINNLNIEVDFHFLPFELNPKMTAAGESIASYFSQRMGWSENQLVAYQQSLVTTAAKAGVNIDFSKRTHYYHSRKAHLLMHWAERFNKQTALNELLINAYFKDGLNISDITVLLDIAEAVGLNRQKTETALASTHLNQGLEEKSSRLKTLNISSVPAFIVNGNSLISGSNSVQYFEDALSAFINEPLSV
ncbi:MAG: hypothetical protein COC19_06275 [SAR86 cluster bacterium]|uniref:DSBA-like thioredoxin domain-containing protein n=1 Tax=SAR86 cluster bacterium TaxID=2030880 RepID=A0A2A4MKL2_9GAMM|nr:MAG: hypothetical protein COC19_06275 [SAR86 cluster bacterium]